MTTSAGPLSGNIGMRKRFGLSRLTRVLSAFASASGASAVEFALAIPIFLGLVLGTIEMGRVMFTQAIVYYAAQEATRWAVGNPKTAEQTEQQYADLVADHTESRLILISPNNTATVTAVAPADPTDGTRLVTVTVSYSFEFMLPFLGIGPIQLNSNSAGFLIQDLG